MYPRAIVIAVLFSLFLPGASADTLQVAVRGKKQKVSPHHGILSSFDGTTLIFEELAAGPKSGYGIQATQFPVKNNVITITLSPRDTQEPVDPYRPEAYFKSPEERAFEAGMPFEEPVEVDLTHCSGPGTDQVVEASPQSGLVLKFPISGKIQRIVDGIVVLKRGSDSAIVKYQIDGLSEIKIGVCQ